jgi:hypothetical protein
VKKNRWKGCCYLCSGAYTDRRRPADSTPFRVLRQLGKKRRLSNTD